MLVLNILKKQKCQWIVPKLPKQARAAAVHFYFPTKKHLDNRTSI